MNLSFLCGYLRSGDESALGYVIGYVKGAERYGAGDGNDVTEIKRPEGWFIQNGHPAGPNHVFYNLLEGLVSVFLGLEDETLSLLGFGIDSFVEVISGIGIWFIE